MTTLCAETTQFLSAQPLNMFIGGRWAESLSGAAFETCDPGTGAVIACVSAGDAADVGRAIQAAGEAFRKSGWGALPANDRGVILHRLADLIDKHQETIVEIESMDVGKPRAQAAGFDVPHAAKTLCYGSCNLSGCGGGVWGADTFWDYLRAQPIVRPPA
jgi:acyl-CoA reductase-like NAD-dependent aldehyde dehydrogenase